MQKGKIMPKYENISAIANSAVAQIAGLDESAEIDVHTFVDVGNTVISSNDNTENFYNVIMDKIGKDIYVNRSYISRFPWILRTAGEYGSIIRKIRIKDTDATANPAYSLVAGTAYSDNVFSPSEISQKIFNKREGFEIDVSIPTVQVKSAFTSFEDMNAFISAIYTAVENSQRARVDAVTKLAIMNFIANKINSSNGVIDILALYNSAYSETKTAAEFIFDEKCMKFAAFVIQNYKAFLQERTALFTTDETLTFTPDEYQHGVFIAPFLNAMKVFLQSDIFNPEMTNIGTFDSIAAWQSPETVNYNMADITRINIKANNATTQGISVNRNFIIGIIFDRDAIGAHNSDYRVPTALAKRGEFINSFYKFDVSYFNDLSENAVVFTLGTGSNP